MACFATPFGLRYAAHCFYRAHAQQTGSTLIETGGKLGYMYGRPLRRKSFCLAMSTGRVHPCIRPVRAAPHGCWS